MWHKRLLIRAFLFIGIVLTISSCHYRYYRTVTEKQAIALGSIHFEGAELQLGEANSIERALMLQDTSKTYIGIGVLIEDKLDYGRMLVLVADSILVELDEPFTSYWISTEMRDNHYHGPYDGLLIRPIGVPGDYKRDFDVSFRLRAYDKKNGELVFTDRFTAHIEYYDHRYFLFDSPYD